MAPVSRVTRTVGRPGSHSMLLAALLVCTLGWRRLLAYEAHDAARSHRATAERAFHDYAAVAAWELVAGVNESLQSSLGGALAPDDARPRDVAIRAASRAERSRVERGQRAALRAAGDDSRGSIFASTFATVARDLRRHAFAGDAHVARRYNHDARTKRLQAGLGYAIVLGGPSLEERGAIAYAVKYAEHSAPIAAYGFRTCPDVIGPSMIRTSIARRALLPASVSRGASNDSIVSIMVRDRNSGSCISRAQTQSSPYSADGPSSRSATHRSRDDPPTRGGAARVRSDPRIARPLLVGLLTLTAAMVA